MQYSLCIDSIYPKNNLKEKLKKIKQAGFKFIEFWDWRDKDFELIINSGLKVTNFSGNRVSFIFNPGQQRKDYSRSKCFYRCSKEIKM